MVRSVQLGRRLQALRLLRGFDTTACAAAAGVSERRLVAAEGGEVDESILKALSAYFGVDPAELTGGYVVGTSGATVFLRHGPMTDIGTRELETLERALRLARAATANDRAGILSMCREVRGRFVPVAVAGPKPAHAARQGYRLARMARAVLGLGHGPALDLRALLEERLGVVVVTERFNAAKLRAAAIIDQNRSAIAVVLRGSAQVVQARALLAHELCHVLFDEIPSELVRLDLDVRVSGKVMSLEESRANGFAAEFLLPFAGLRELLGEACMCTSDSRRGEELVARASAHFGAPWQMTTYHLCNLGILSESVLEDVLWATPVHPRVRGVLPAPGAGSLCFGALDVDPRDVPEIASRSAQLGRAALTGGLGAWCEPEPDDVTQAWATLRDEDAELTERIEALQALFHRSDASLPHWLLAEIERDDLPSNWRDEVLFVVEQTQFSGADVRDRVTNALHRTAEAILTKGGRPEALGAALRRFASMVPAEDSDRLLRFLRDECDDMTLRVSLRGVFHIFSEEEPLEIPAVTALRERVRALVDRHVSVERVRTSQDAALAYACIEAAEALDLPERDELLQRFARLGRTGLQARAEALRGEIDARRLARRQRSL